MRLRKIFTLPGTALIFCPVQLFVMGHAAQTRMQSSDILIVGLRGIGVEIGEWGPTLRDGLGSSVCKVRSDTEGNEDRAYESWE